MAGRPASRDTPQRAARERLRKRLHDIAYHGEISEAEMTEAADIIRPPARQKKAAAAVAARKAAEAAAAPAPAKRPPGRPRKDQNGEKERLLTQLQEGVTFRRACQAVGVSLATMWAWHEQDDVFRVAFARARDAAYRCRIDEALDRAQAATDKDAAYCARVVADIALKTLELHQRSQQLQVNLTGGTGGPVSITWAIAGAASGETQSTQIVIEGKADAAG